MAAVIEQALRDALDKEHSVGAARFIQGDDLIPFADAAGVEPEYVRDVFTRAIGYAARESW